MIKQKHFWENKCQGLEQKNAQLEEAMSLGGKLNTVESKSTCTSEKLADKDNLQEIIRNMTATIKEIEIATTNSQNSFVANRLREIGQWISTNSK